MRLIDADALMKEFPCTCGCKHCGQGKDGFLPCDIKDKIKAAPTIDSFGTWIPVEERLPEEDDTDDLKYYLVWYEYFRYGDYNKMFQTYGIAYFLCGRWGGDDMNGTNVKVLAWMPLPKPYEVKSNDT